MSNQGTIISLKPSELVDAIELMAPTKLSFFIWGPPGVAKSSIINQYGARHNRKVIDIRLSQIDAVDLRGMPYMPKGVDENSEEFGMKWSAPALLPKDPDSTDIIFLDEFPNALPSVHSTAYQLILDRKLGDYVVPENCIIIAAGNREGDRGNTFKLGAPISNRFVHFEIAPDFNSWRDWAVTAGIDSSIVGFLSAFNDEAYRFTPSTNERSFPTYRTWEFVDRILKSPKFEDSKKLIQEAAISGAVGSGAATKFIATRNSVQDLPDVNDVLTGRVTEIKALDVGLSYALTTSMCYALRNAYEDSKAQTGDKAAQAKEKYTSMCNYFLKFMMDNFKPEIVMMGSRTALTTFRLNMDFTKIPVFKDFTARYKGLLV